MTSESTALAREAESPPVPIRRRFAILGFLALLVGAASALNALSEAAPRDSPLTYASTLRWALTGAALATALILGVDGLIRRAACALAPNARQRFLRLDLFTWAVLLAVFVGAAGVHVNATIVTILILVLTAFKALALYVSLDDPQRAQAFSSLGYLAFLFLISGFAALIYQIVWQRTLFTAFGVNIESTTLIVSLFMFGLGLGSVAGGLISRRFPNRAPLLFLICEVGIGCFGIFSIPLINGVARLTLHGSLAQVTAAIFALLCFPTMLMGATLPVLVGHLYRHYRNVGKSVGLLYCINTLGSAIACFITADILFVLLGQQAAVFTAAGCNLIVGILVWRYGRRVPSNGEAPAAAEPKPSGRANGISPRFLLVLFFAVATGYISLSQEMLWMRAVSYITGGHPAVFAHVLGCFLIGVALGAFAGDKLCERFFAKPGAAALRFIAGALLLCGVFYYVSIAATAACTHGRNSRAQPPFILRWRLSPSCSVRSSRFYAITARRPPRPWGFPFRASTSPTSSAPRSARC